MPPTFLHASDLRLGLAFPHAVSRAEELRAARLDALRALLVLATREKVTALLLAGNTLADNRVSHRDVMDLVSLLGTSSVPVYLLPGLTDPYTPDSPYALRPDLFVDPIHVLTDSTPLELGGVTVLPFPVRARGVVPDFHHARPEGPHLGLACAGPPAAPLGLDYVAMGGHPLPQTHGTAHWCGAVEPFDFGHTSGQAHLISLPSHRPLATGRFTWLNARPAEIAHPETTLLKLSEPASDLPRLFYLEAPEELHVPPFHHPLLQGMTAEIDACEDPETGRAALARLYNLVGGREDFS